MMSSMQDVHKLNLKMLKDFDRFCNENQIEYFLMYGGLLGSIRHENFIPWDDDVDICLTRDNYDKVIRLKDKLSNDVYEFINPLDFDNKFYDCICKISCRMSQWHNPTDEDRYYDNKYNRICLDLFVLDYIGPSIFGKIQILLLRILYGMLISKRFIIDYRKYTIEEKIKVRFLSSIGKMFPLRMLLNGYNYISRLYNGKGKSKMLFPSNATMMHIHKLYSEKWFSEKMEGKIGDEKFSIPKYYDEILRVCYGEYLKLPPLEKRVPDHIELESVKIWCEL